MKLTIRQLRYILKTAEEGSLTEASKALSVSQATLSGVITQVEEYLGFKIFSRGRRGTEPTEQGLEFLNYARRAVLGMDLLEAHYGHAENTELAFSVAGQNFAFAEWALGDIAKRDEFALYDCQYSVEAVGDTIKMVSSGAADMGFVRMTDATEGPLSKLIADAGLEFRKMASLKPYVLTTEAHPLAKRKRLAPKDLIGYPEYQLDQYLHLSALNGLPEQGPLVYYNGVRVYDASMSVGSLVRSIAEMEGYSVWSNLRKDEMVENGVVAVPLDTSDVIRFGYIVPKSIVLSDIEKAYLDEISKVIRENGDSVC